MNDDAVADGTAPFSCVLIGEGSLLVNCAEILKAGGHRIARIVSTAPAIVEWAAAEEIALGSLGSGLAEDLSSEPFDYLFSITNLSIIPDEVLELARRGAINFHDGPLPRYAGLHATSWALIHEETVHGITWHEMVADIDAGRIFEQETVLVDADDTAFTLNAKCYDAARNSFARLVDGLAAGRAVPTEQDSEGRSYFGRDRRPAAACSLPWEHSASSLDALVRALDFGPYENPLGLPKIRVGNDVYVVRDLAEHTPPTDRSDDPAPGTITHLDGILRVATGSGDVDVTELVGVDGREWSIAELTDRHALEPGAVLPSFDAETSSALTELHERLSRRESFWRSQLADLVPTEPPFADSVRSTDGSDEPATSCWTISDGTRERIAAGGVSAPTDDLVTALLVAFLARSTGTQECAVLYSHVGLRDEIGDFGEYFATSVPVRVPSVVDAAAVENLSSTAEHLERVRSRSTFARDLPLRSPDLGSPAGEERWIQIDHVGAEPADHVALPAEGWLSVRVADDGTLALTADRGVPQDDVDRFLERFDAFVESIAADPTRPVSEASLMTASTRARLLEEWNRTEVPYDTASCVHDLIAAQVDRTPDRPALVFGDEQLTYRELDARANQLARTLRKLGVGPGSFVGVFLERSVDMLVGLVAVLKAGGAYVPLDPSYPADRIAFMVDDAQISVLLTETALTDLLSTTEPTVLTVDGSWNLIALEDDTELDAAAQPDDLAYMIYTSGSTGRPKGVMIEHRNVANFFAGMDRCVPHDPDDPGTWLAATSISFDISVLELFWTLSRGFTVVLHREDRVDETESVEVASPRATRPIDFGLFYFASDEDAQDQDGKYDLLLTGARFADENGFSSIWTPERHFHRFGGLYPNPSVASAAIAAITENVDIRAGSCVLPLHDPIRVAEEWSLVDNLSAGRVGISFAAGWQPNDFVLRPQAFATRTEDMYRDIGVVRQLWRGEAIEVPGPDGEPVSIRTLPRPIQSDLPVWITIAGNPESYRRAGVGGFNVLTHLLGQSIDELGEKIELYRASWRDSGHDGEGLVTVMLHTFVGDDIESVKEVVREPMKAYLQSAVDLIRNAAWNFPTFQQRASESGQSPVDLLESDEVSAEDFDALLDFAFERYFRTSGLFGTPESCLDVVDKMRAIDADEIACLIDFGIPAETTSRHLAHLGRLRELATPPPEPAAPTVAELIERHGVTHFQCTPSQARMLVLDSDAHAALGRLDTLLVGGEELALGLARELRQLVGGRIVNMYGPTETTIWSSTFELGDVIDDVPIGRPIANTQLYVLDEGLEPVPPGVVGELFIGGDGVARGYHGRAELTAERFVDDPFASEPGRRLYRTGDLARHRSDGEIDFLGRVDHQVKIRGYRIELGEIEETLSSHPTVLESVVVAREDVPGNKQLVGYVRLATSLESTPSTLKSHLAETLPDFMVPAHVVEIDALPLTPNGKIDRLALPAPTLAQPDDRTSFAAPSTPAELALAAIWSSALGVDDIGVNDDFFDLGGHSLLAIEVIARLRLEFEVEISMKSIFGSPTIAALAPLIEPFVSDAREADGAVADSSRHRIEPLERQDGWFPLSAAQKRLWFLQTLEPEMFVYNMPKAFRLRGPLDVDALRASVRRIVERHGSLRTTFAVRDGVPAQHVAAHSDLDLAVVDLAHLAEGDRASTVDLLLTEEARRPFDLTTGPVLRLVLLRLDSDDHVFMFNMHHVISDGWSLGIFYRELAALYGARVNGRPDPLPELPVQYVDFGRWQEERLGSDVMAAQLDYWDAELRDAPPLLELPTDHARPSIQSYEGARVRRGLPAETVAGVAELSARRGVTPYMTYLAAYATLLHRYSGRDDIVVGSPIAGRNHPEVENLVGFFVNTLAMRADLDGDPSFEELLQRIKETSIAGFDNQEYPFEQLVAHLAPERSRAHSPLFQAMFILQNTPESEGLSLGDLRVEELEVDHGAAKFDLTLEVLEKPGGHELELEYNESLFQVSTALRILDHYGKLLAAAVANPDEPVSRLSLLSDAERDHLVHGLNETRVDREAGALLHELFDRQASLTPDRPAAVFADRELSYAELESRANMLANHLREIGVRPGELVGISTHRGPEMVVGILGVLKAGCAYVPLDPAYPRDRLDFMLDDSGLSVLLTEESLLGELPTHDARTICLDRDWPSIERAGDAAPPRVAPSDDVAYVIYTSGSTGRPKGVSGRHQGTINRCQWMWDAYPFDDDDRCCQKTSLNFVDSIWEIFGPLLRGVPTVYLDDEVLVQPAELIRVLAGHRVTRLVLVPSLLRAILDAHPRIAEELPDLRVWVCSGEELPVDLARDFEERLPGRTLLNLYGSSEVSADVTYYEVTNARQLTTVPLGRPIANTQVYVLDTAMQPVPVGVTGSIWVGGDGLAAGYLHRPDLTAERFVANPIDPAASERLYRTGDLGRIRSDGLIEFVGREDDQVNVRGFRVELGEVEAALRDLPAVHEGTVGVRSDVPGGPRIVAYAVVEAGTTTESLRESLAARLPGYMLPGTFALLDELPLTPNGKLDRRALERLEIDHGDEFHYRAPRTSLEQSLAEVWQELLGAERIGIDDNFFDLGGHSLLGVELLTRVRSLTGTELPFSALFDAPTIAQLAAALGDEHPVAAGRSSGWAPSVVPIQATGSERPFFHIGGAALLRKLTEYLGPEQPIFSIMEQPLDDVSPLFTDMDSVVDYCLTGLRSVQPEGPYLLGGLCFGGFAAVELARTLREQGEQVDTLFVVEAYVPGSVEAARNDGGVRFGHAAARYYADSVRRDGMGYVVETTRHKVRKSMWKAANWGTRRTGLALPRRFRNIVLANNFIADRYVPGEYDGRVVLIDVEERDARFDYPDDLGWTDVMTGDVSVYTVPGGHLSAYEEPHVRHIAARLADELAVHRGVGLR